MPLRTRDDDYFWEERTGLSISDMDGLIPMQLEWSGTYRAADAGELSSPARENQTYLKWLPAPMKNNMGIESRKFTREANNAVRPHWGPFQVARVAPDRPLNRPKFPPRGPLIAFIYNMVDRVGSACRGQVPILPPARAGLLESAH